MSKIEYLRPSLYFFSRFLIDIWSVSSISRRYFFISCPHYWVVTGSDGRVAHAMGDRTKT
ncbi:MAG: hypothetical protein ACFB02_07620 [Mastigocoleus sp.]